MNTTTNNRFTDFDSYFTLNAVVRVPYTHFNWFREMKNLDVENTFSSVQRIYFPMVVSLFAMSRPLCVCAFLFFFFSKNKLKREIHIKYIEVCVNTVELCYLFCHDGQSFCFM